ncbi:MAG: hypothetical protein ACI9XP_001934 [Lentimonas sp.]|jgi:hypothetical protein
MKFGISIFFLLLFNFGYQAQTGTSTQAYLSLKKRNITGKIVDSASYESLEFVSVRLFSRIDSSVVSGAFTDSSGQFILTDVFPGSYYMKMTSIGYSDKTINKLNITENKEGMDLGLIGLRISSFQDLGEVKVVGELDVLKAGIDKKIYNVAEDLNNIGANTTDVLNNVPSVDVDQDGNISLRGDGNVIILIDGRPSSLVTSLDALPANSIERIEIVTNPSAKYDPDGTSGIINIVLKKNKLKGVNGSVSMTAATGSFLRGNANVSVRNRKINIFTNYGYDYSEYFRNYYGDLKQTNNSTQTNLTQERLGQGIRQGQNLQFGVDYSLTEQKTLGISMFGRTNTRQDYSVLQNDLLINDNLERSWQRISVDPRDDQNLDLSLTYSHKFKDDLGDFSASFNGSQSNRGRDGFYFEKYDIENGMPIEKNVLMQRLENNTNAKVYSTQADYTKVISKWKARMEAGAKAIFRDEDVNTFSEEYDYSKETWSPDSLANFLYSYSERIYSTYGIWGQQVGKWKYQVGVRGEYSQQNPFLITDSLEIKNEYYNLFPSGHLRYDLGKKKEVSFSYSRRINRPRSWQLNPFVNYSDPLNLRSGNSYLKPEYIDSYDLGFSQEFKLLDLTASAFYRNTTNVIQRVKVFYQNNTGAVTYANIDESNSYGLEMIIGYKPYKWMRNSLSMNADHIRFIDKTGESNYNNTGYNFSAKFSSKIDFWKKTASVQVNGNYNAPRITAQGKILPRSTMSISAEKRFFDNKLSLGLRLSDIFNTQGFRFELDQEFVSQTGDYKWQTRRLFLTLTYKFGKLEMGRDDENGGGSGGDGGGFSF